MAKTYILEPTELEFVESLEGNESLTHIEPALLSPDDIMAIPNNAVAQVGDKTFKFSLIEESTPEGPTCWFDEDGNMDTYEDDRMFISSSTESSQNLISTTLSAGTYTVSIYTGEDDPEPTPGSIPGLEDKNVVYEYQMLAQSNMKDICLALKELRAALDSETDYPENPGYSVTKDMANTLKDIVVARGGTVEAKEYFNDLEAIADYIKILAGIVAAEADAS